MLSIISLYYKIYFFFCPIDKSPLTNYQILSQDEFTKIGDNYILKEVIYKDRIQSTQTTTNRVPTSKQEVIREPLFLCGTRENTFIKELKKKAYIGVKNFPMFDEISNTLDNEKNLTISLQSELNLQKSELKAKLILLDFFKNELSIATFDKLVHKHEQTLSISDSTNQNQGTNSRLL